MGGTSCTVLRRQQHMSLAIVLPLLAGGQLPDDSLTLLAVGDWGGTSNDEPTNANQLAVAGAMQAVAATKRPHAVLMMGDNFYRHGLNCADDAGADFGYGEAADAHYDVVVVAFSVALPRAIRRGMSGDAAFERTLAEAVAVDTTAAGEAASPSNVRDMRLGAWQQGGEQTSRRVELSLVRFHRDPEQRRPASLLAALNRALEAGVAGGQGALGSAFDARFGGSGSWRMSGVTARVGRLEDRPCNQKHSPRFNATFEEVYRGPGLDGARRSPAWRPTHHSRRTSERVAGSQVPFYVNAGNHDYYGFVRAQVDYSNDPPAGASGRWRRPAGPIARPTCMEKFSSLSPLFFRYPVTDARPSHVDGSLSTALLHHSRSLLSESSLSLPVGRSRLRGTPSACGGRGTASRCWW